MTHQEELHTALLAAFTETLKQRFGPFADAYRSLSTPEAADAHAREEFGHMLRLRKVLTEEIDANVKD